MITVNLYMGIEQFANMVKVGRPPRKVVVVEPEPGSLLYSLTKTLACSECHEPVEIVYNDPLPGLRWLYLSCPSCGRAGSLGRSSQTA